MNFTVSYSPAYPSEQVEYPPYNKGLIFSPLSNLANAPFCHKIGAMSLGTSSNLLTLTILALNASSHLSSNIFQNFSMSPLDEKATSGKLIVVTPTLNLP